MITELAGDNLEWLFTLVGPSNTESQLNGKLEEENQAEIKNQKSKIIPKSVQMTSSAN